MRTPAALLLLLAACGARTDLEVDTASRDAATAPCSPMTPERLSTVDFFPLDAADGRVWGDILNVEQEIGFIDSEGELTVVATDQFGTKSLVVDGEVAFWGTAGFSDDTGAIMRGDIHGEVRTLVPGLAQPGALDLQGEWVTYAVWTNLPSLGDDGRASVARVSRDGSRLEEWIDGRGMPTATAHLDGELFWLDRRREQVATLPPGTLTPRIVAGVDSVRRPMIAWNTALYVAAPGRESEALIRVGRTMPPEPFAVASLDDEVRHLVGIDTAAARGIVIGTGSVASTSRIQYFRLRDNEVVLVDQGSHPATDDRHLFWLGSEGVMRVCLEALERL